MKRIDLYINEKLKINKDSKLDLNIEIKFPFFIEYIRDMSYHTLIRTAIKEYGIKLDDKADISLSKIINDKKIYKFTITSLETLYQIVTFILLDNNIKTIKDKDINSLIKQYIYNWNNIENYMDVCNYNSNEFIKIFTDASDLF